MRIAHEGGNGRHGTLQRRLATVSWAHNGRDTVSCECSVLRTRRQGAWQHAMPARCLFARCPKRRPLVGAESSRSRTHQQHARTSCGYAPIGTFQAHPRTQPQLYVPPPLLTLHRHLTSENWQLLHPNRCSKGASSRSGGGPACLRPFLPPAACALLAPEPRPTEPMKPLAA